MGKKASAPIEQERVHRSSKKKRRDVQRRSASLPAQAERLGPIISTVLKNSRQVCGASLAR